MLNCSKAINHFRRYKPANFLKPYSCHYHSYPDPNEQPKISSTVSSAVRSMDKNGDDFILDSKFNLKRPFPGTNFLGSKLDGKAPETISSVLENGLTVATQEVPGLMSSFTFVVKTGSSYENQQGPNSELGSCHFLELNAFRSTSQRSHMQLITDIEMLGGMVQCISTRENILYCVDVLRANIEPALEILAESILQPKFPEEELEESKMIVQLQQDELPSEVFSRDLIQRAGYIGSPLGNHHFCPPDKVELVTAKSLQDFRSKYFFGENCLVAATGVEHDSFVAIVKEKFKHFPKGNKSSIQIKQSKFSGGLLKNERTLKEPFVKFAMAFEVGGWKGDKLIPVCVLQQLLGGGSSFSAGGPGKGMYTRLYTQVLNRYYWAESIEAFVSIHEDHGLLGIDGACPPDSIVPLIRVIIDQFTSLAKTPVTAEELSRAKNMLKSMMMMQLESRLVLCEDIARQYATFDKRESPDVICKKIDSVTAEDLMKVAQHLFTNPPAVSAVGHDLSQVPAYEDIRTYVQQFYVQANGSKKN